MKRSFFKKTILLYVVAIFAALMVFQNCAKTKFNGIESSSLSSAKILENPICSLESKPLALDYLACLAPNQNIKNAIQNYDVICSADGSWTRNPIGEINYGLCSNSCVGSPRPSDFENVTCPAPLDQETKGVQKYAVTCSSQGVWSRAAVSSVDYSLCTKVCDPSIKPGVKSVIACPAPFSTVKSGIENFEVKCNSNGTWSRQSISTDFANCSQSCNPANRLADFENMKCPNSADMTAVQNYSVTCAANGSWVRSPTTFDSSKCPAPLCNASSKPPTSENVACLSPYQSSQLAVQNYNVSCSGTSWVVTAGARDDSACPKACTAVKPANDQTKVACQSPNQASLLAVQNYTYVCNSTTANYDRTLNGPVNYSSCPLSCTGSNPATPVAIACPTGQTGTAYQNRSSTCNTSTGQWSTPISTNVNVSGCQTSACSGSQPSNFDSVACPSPFQTRLDAKKMYAPATCVSGSWVRGAATGAIDTSSCPVNDCSASPNPGTEKIIAVCPGGASGQIFQSCSLSCTGNTYSQINCSANNYSRCACGANSIYDVASQSCVKKTCLALCADPSWSQGKTVASTSGAISADTYKCDYVGTGTVVTFNFPADCTATYAAPPAVNYIGTCDLKTGIQGLQQCELKPTANSFIGSLPGGSTITATTSEVSATAVRNTDFTAGGLVTFTKEQYENVQSFTIGMASLSTSTIGRFFFITLQPSNGSPGAKIKVNIVQGP